MEKPANNTCPDIEGRDILPEPKESKLARVGGKLTRLVSMLPTEAPDYMSNHYRGKVQEDEAN